MIPVIHFIITGNEIIKYRDAANSQKLDVVVNNYLLVIISYYN